MADITNYILTLNTDFTTKTSKILLSSPNFSLYSYCVRSCPTVAIHPHPTPWTICRALGGMVMWELRFTLITPAIIFNCFLCWLLQLSSFAIWPLHQATFSPILIIINCMFTVTLSGTLTHEWYSSNVNIIYNSNTLYLTAFGHRSNIAFADPTRYHTGLYNAHYTSEGVTSTTIKSFEIVVWSKCFTYRYNIKLKY